MTQALPKEQLWHGIPRAEIPWHPTVDADACIGCSLCYVSCGRGVYNMQDNKAVVENPYSCMVGCSTCATVCPMEAISFPSRDVVWKLEREHKIFKTVRKEAAQKKEKAEVMKARAAAQESAAAVTTGARLEVAGQFGEKRVLARLGELIHERPYDIVNVKMEIPTVKALQEKAPGYLVFEVASTGQEEISSFLTELRAFIRDSDLVLVSETKM